MQQFTVASMLTRRGGLAEYLFLPYTCTGTGDEYRNKCWTGALFVMLTALNIVEDKLTQYIQTLWTHMGWYVANILFIQCLLQSQMQSHL